MDRVNLSAHGFYAIPDVSMDWDSGHGRPYSYYTYGVGCSEVEVDCLTGNFQVILIPIPTPVFFNCCAL